MKSKNEIIKMKNDIQNTIRQLTEQGLGQACHRLRGAEEMLHWALMPSEEPEPKLWMTGKWAEHGVVHLKENLRGYVVGMVKYPGDETHELRIAYGILTGRLDQPCTQNRTLNITDKAAWEEIKKLVDKYLERQNNVIKTPHSPDMS